MPAPDTATKVVLKPYPRLPYIWEEGEEIEIRIQVEGATKPVGVHLAFVNDADAVIDGMVGEAIKPSHEFGDYWVVQFVMAPSRRIEHPEVEIWVRPEEPVLIPVEDPKVVVNVWPIKVARKPPPTPIRSDLEIDEDEDTERALLVLREVPSPAPQGVQRRKAQEPPETPTLGSFADPSATGSWNPGAIPINDVHDPPPKLVAPPICVPEARKMREGRIGHGSVFAVITGGASLIIMAVGALTLMFGLVVGLNWAFSSDGAIAAVAPISMVDILESTQDEIVRAPDPEPIMATMATVAEEARIDQVQEEAMPCVPERGDGFEWLKTSNGERIVRCGGQLFATNVEAIPLCTHGETVRDRAKCLNENGTQRVRGFRFPNRHPLP